MKYQIDIRTVSKFAKRRSLRKYTREWKNKLMLFNAHLRADLTMMEARRKMTLFPGQILDNHPESGV